MSQTGDRSEAPHRWPRVPPATLALWLAVLAVAAALTLRSVWREDSATLSILDLRTLADWRAAFWSWAVAQAVEFACHVPLGALTIAALPGRACGRTRGGARLCRILLLASSAALLVALAGIAPHEPWRWPDALDLFAPLAGWLVGVDLGLLARSRPVVRWRLAAANGAALLLLVVGLGWAAKLATADAPLPLAAVQVSAEDRQRLSRTFRERDPAGQPREIALSDEDANRLLAWLSGISAADRGARIAYYPGGVEVRASLPLRATDEPPRYLNVVAQVDATIDSGRLRLDCRWLRLGRLTVPAPLSSELAQRLAARIAGDPRLGPLLGRIDRLRISPAAMEMTLNERGRAVAASQLAARAPVPPTPIFEGVTYRCERLDESAEGGGLVHAVEIDLATPGVDLYLTPVDPAASAGGGEYRLANAETVLASAGLAAVVNAASFDLGGTFLLPLEGDAVRGIETIVSEGQVNHVDRHSHLLWFDENLTPRLDRDRPPMAESLRQARFAIGSQSIVLDEGRVLARPGREVDRRTAAGIDPAGRRLWLAVFERASYRLAAETLARYGARSAIALDGGSSTTMAVAENPFAPAGAVLPGLSPVATFFGVRARHAVAVGGPAPRERGP